MTCLTIPSSTSHAEWRIHHMKYRSQLRGPLEELIYDALRVRRLSRGCCMKKLQVIA